MPSLNLSRSNTNMEKIQSLAIIIFDILAAGLLLATAIYVIFNAHQISVYISTNLWLFPLAASCVVMAMIFFYLVLAFVLILKGLHDIILFLLP